MCIRILQIVNNLSYCSGVMTMIMNLYHHIDRTKIQFDFLVHMPSDPSHEQKIMELGGRVYYLSKPSIRTTYKYLREINQFFTERTEYKIIHGHAPVLTIFYLPAAIKHGIPYRITHSHNTRYSDSSLKSFRNFFLQLPLKYMTNVFFACSQEAGRFLFGKKHLGRHKVHLLHNAIDPFEFCFNETIRRQCRHDLGIADKYVIGHVGRFVNQKNHLFLIDVFLECTKLQNNVVLLLVGGGELEAVIKKKVAGLALTEKVYFLGNRRDVSRLMQSFDAFVFPSHFEGLGLAAIEAQAAGLPCFVSDRVPQEVKVTNLVEILPLQQSAVYWANRILANANANANSHSREDMTEAISKAGYDIRDTAGWLQKFYWELYHNE